MSGDGRHDDEHPEHSAEAAIADLRATTERKIGEWSDARLDAVIARLRLNSVRKPDNFALLMFLEDARLRRHEMRQATDGHGQEQGRHLHPN